MLFESLVPNVFRDMNAGLFSAANKARKQDVMKRLDYFHGEMLDYLEEQLNELFSDPSQMVKCHLNIVQKITTQLAMTYRSPPARTIVDGAESDQAIYEEMVRQSALDVKLKQASRYVKLLKTILLRPVWRRDQLELDVLTGDILDVVCGDTPEDLLEVLITDYGTSQRVEDVTFSHWTAEEWHRLDHNGNTLEQAPNPYARLPFLPCWDYPPDSSNFFLPGGSDLIAIQEAINLKLTDLLYLISQQSFGVGYIKGSPGGGNLRVDPGSLVELEETGEIGFKSQQAEITAVVDAIEKLVRWACVSNGLSAASMSTDLTDRMSGTAKSIDLLELSELRQDDISLFRSYEKRLFSLMRTVWNVHNPSRKLSESATLKIDFGEVRPPADPKAQAEAHDLMLSMGVISQVDIAMQMNPDFSTREEALAHLLKIKEESRELLSE